MPFGFSARRLLPHVLFSSFLLLQNPLSALAYDPKACNNSPNLCSQPYGNIIHLGTHNSPFLRDASTSWSTSGNQYFDVTVQLDAGVRFLQGQLHAGDAGAEPRLCHSSCSLMDGGSLGDWLADIKAWMDAHPSDVVTILIVNDDRVAADGLLPSFQRTGMDKIAYVPPSGKKIRDFPKLQNMIDDKKQLVVFVTSGGGSEEGPFLLTEWDYIWETAWENMEQKDMQSCEVDRPGKYRGEGGLKSAEEAGLVPLLNWFLYKDAGLGILRPLVEEVGNTNGIALKEGLKNCREEWGDAIPPPRNPNFILVDFFNEGNPISLVDILNNVTLPVNRVSSPKTPHPDDRSIGSSSKGRSKGERQLDDLLLRVKMEAMVPTFAEWILATGDWGVEVRLPTQL